MGIDREVALRAAVGTAGHEPDNEITGQEIGAIRGLTVNAISTGLNRLTCLGQSDRSCVAGIDR